MALVNAAYRAVTFTGSVPESDRESTVHWIADLTYPILTQDCQPLGGLRDCQPLGGLRGLQA
ncbi:hypothetical protein Taro_051107 [Colocasia esculenta]|uniref:Uncharacterized protein n=1 Tax=Colocasia esculenta TaxID=4460 RepID=A0A843XFS8_COLES|nr:hypothetical protein [Colocasia esculenta]